MALGIFTSITGNPPIAYLQHRMAHRPTSVAPARANYELRLYEGQSRFDVIYGTVLSGNTSATAGVQKNDTAL